MVGAEDVGGRVDAEVNDPNTSAAPVLADDVGWVLLEGGKEANPPPVLLLPVLVPVEGTLNALNGSNEELLG